MTGLLRRSFAEPSCQGKGMVAYGNYLREIGYALKKAGLDWLRL
jgi:hypothetical protein